MIAFCIAAGMLFRKNKLVPADSYKGINIWLIYIALPAVSFRYLPKIEWSPTMFFPVLAMFVVWGGAWVFTEFFSKKHGYKQRSRSTLELATGYSNTSFIGFPLVAAYFGEDKLGIAMICDQTSFIILSTAGVISALRAKGRGENIKPQIVIRRLVTFPPLIACVLSLTLAPIVNFSVADPFLDMLVATLAPMAIFSIGLQLQFNGWKKQLSQVSMSLLYKLILAPLLVLILALSLGVRDDIGRVSVLEAAMPTLISSSIIAEQYGLNTKLLNLIIGVGIILGIMTTAIWQFVVKIYL